MPQMAPISWLILFILFTLTFLLFNMLNYFCYYNKNYSKKSDNTNKSNFFNLNWKW